MTDLTEQWKKGGLPSGWYWVELKEGTFADGKKSIVLDYFSELTNSFERHPYLVEQVLAEVPDYEEWKAKLEENARLKKQINHLLKTQARQFVDNQKLQVKAEKAKDVVNIDTARQIKQLKELLKECRDYLPEFETPMDILAKIDEALR